MRTIVNSDRRGRRGMGSSRPEELEQAWAELEQWGSEPELNELDALMWRTERVPDGSWAGVVVMLLDTAPDFELFERLYEWGTRKVPRMRDRVVDPVLPVGRPMWEPDPHFDVRSHLGRVVLPAPGTMRQLLDWAQRMGTRPMDRNRPPWRTWLVEGLKDGKAAWVLQCHHVLMDGGSATQLFGRILPRTRKLPPGGGWPEPPSRSRVGRRGVRTRQLTGQVRNAPALAAGVLEATGRILMRPGDAARYAASLWRVLSPPPSTNSRWLRGGRREEWRFGALECPLADLKAAGKAVGGTVNDAFVCAI